ncbi:MULTISPECIES: class I SAM-dependent methyltransferase [Halorubrum]|uniref:Methyltransferase, putative n=1 Tax=Halorubrum hochstenium ATCC 700873 TaxID=1227481 RepID=M0F3B0_9EURY|nr:MULTISPECIES: class I SAM-dependent methyltransferase [Halorubrum]ELZ54410.1 Methyltransferase, putative [Halorubrum hochstenium ATCC 700873]
MAFPSTIDWEEHWRTTDRASLDGMRAAGERMADRLDRLFEPFPESVADVGCGPGFALFALSRRHPEASLFGYDAAESVLRGNRSLADAEGAENLTFETARLPEFDVDRRFECVTCIATLHYVEAIVPAIEALYARVEPGGRLIFNYPNRHTRAAYRSDPETDPERFELLLDGENLLTYDEIRDALGTRPRSFWKAVGEDDWRSIGQTNPCVIVEK